MRETKPVVIIGAGIAGLSAGCYLQMNGYATEIYELGPEPGGLCAAWKRNGYTFDGCIHWLVGSNPESSFHPLWRELGALDDATPVLDFDEFVRVEGKGDNRLTVYTDLDEFEAELGRVAPEDKKEIGRFIGAARRCASLNFPIEKPSELYSFADTLKMLFTVVPAFLPVYLWLKISVKSYTRRFKNAFLREAFCRIFPENISVFAFIITLAWMHRKDAGYPLGGSWRFARSIEGRYRSLGGTVHYNRRVKKITVENGRATGIVLDDGTAIGASTVISAADGHSTLFAMLGEEYVSADLKKAYDTFTPFSPIVQVSFGINRDLKDLPHAVMFTPENPLQVDPRTVSPVVWVRILHFDPLLAPEGKTVMQVLCEADYDYWVPLRRNDREKYRQEKERLAGDILAAIDRRFGNIREHAEVTDVATPATLVRYTNNWKGSFEGWLPTPETIGKSLRKKLPGIENFYMIGQWLEPGGGLPTAAMHGRHIAQILCRRDRTPFTVKMQESSVKGIKGRITPSRQATAR